MPKIDLAAVPFETGATYPAPYDEGFEARAVQRLGRAGGLTQFGANLVVLEPGGRSALRHWHAAEDEFVMVVSGDLVLLEDAGETAMGPGDCAAFPAGREDGHQLVNRSDREARFLVVGTRAEAETVRYPDLDLMVTRAAGATRGVFTRKDGSPL